MTITRHETDQSKAMLTVSHLTLGQQTGNRLLNDVSFEVHKGEIFGIAGVDGNGQTELVECLTGLRHATSGTAVYKDLDLAKSPTREIMRRGVSHVPADRQKSGLILTMNLAENMILQDYYQPAFGRGPMLNWRYINEYSDRLIREFQVKAPSRYELAQNLSGGNQQKVIIAREISREPGLLIAMHPTRGVDVGAIEYIHHRIMEERDAGRAVLLVSTELDEVMKLSDRVAVMYEGEIMGIVRPQDVTVADMGLMMGGQRREEHSPAAG